MSRFPVQEWRQHPADWGYMGVALAQAQAAAEANEVPIGACLVVGGQVVAQAGNAPLSQCDPTAHAEIQVIRQAARALANQRLGGTLYVTLQPCLMCLGALFHARVERVVVGAADSRFNSSLHHSLEPFRASEAWHNCSFDLGCRAEESQALLQAFFASKRHSREQALQSLQSLADLPNVNKVTVQLLAGLGFNAPVDLLQPGLEHTVRTLQNLVEAWPPPEFQLEEQHLAQQRAVFLSLLDYLQGKPQQPWKAYL